MELRDYQTRAIERGREAFRQGKRAVLMVSPTGSGKTVILSEIARLHYTREGQVIVLAHRIELVKQAVDKLWKTGIRDLGAIAAEGGFNQNAKVVVCSIQTLLARPQLRPKASLIIPDEAHHYLSQEWNKLMVPYAGVPIVGFTATPQRPDGTALGGMFDELLEVATIPELVSAGHLVPITVIGPPCRLEGADIVDPIASLEKYAPNRKAVIFASSVAHGRELVSRLGSDAGYVDGKTGADERAETLRSFESGRIRVLINVFVLTEGWDCPSVEVCVLARGCSSMAAFLQMIGRVRRPSPGKRDCMLIDAKGAVHRHGMPDDSRAYSLTGKPIAVDKALPAVRQCPACGAVFRMRAVCERCSYVFPVAAQPVERKAELKQIDNVTPESSKRAFFRSQLEKAAEQGKKPGWAMHRYRWRFGYWPPQQWLKEEGASA